MGFPAVGSLFSDSLLVSVNSAGTDSDNAGSGFSPIDISAEGRFVAFKSDASDLVATDIPMGRGTSLYLQQRLKLETAMRPTPLQTALALTSSLAPS